MRLVWQYIRSIAFIVQMYVAIILFGVFGLFFLLFGKRHAYKVTHAYSAWVRWTAAWMVGLRTEVRGTPPTGAALVAAKHQSFLDILLITEAMPNFRAIMKAELKYLPIIGWYGWATNSIPVNRGKKGAAITQMVADVKAGRVPEGQLMIYPQGTRVAAGAKKPYKIGVAVLYEQLGDPCYPVATNVGVFWPRHGLLRKPGLAVVEFLPPIPPGLPREEFMARLEHDIETASDRLMAEAGLKVAP